MTTTAANVVAKKWWGYRHTAGTVEAQRYDDDRKSIDEAYESDRVAQVIEPFDANSRDEALEVIARRTAGAEAAPGTGGPDREIDRLQRLVVMGYQVMRELAPNIGQQQQSPQHKRIREFCTEAEKIEKMIGSEAVLEVKQPSEMKCASFAK